MQSVKQYYKYDIILMIYRAIQKKERGRSFSFWLYTWKVLGNELLRWARVAGVPSFFQGGGSNKTTHAYSLSLGCLCDFLLLLFGVVRNDSLSDHSRKLPSGKRYRFFFHRPDRSTTMGGQLDPSLGYEPLYVTSTVKVEPNTKKLISWWELGFRAVPRETTGRADLPALCLQA